MSKSGYVYILASKRNGTLYVGVTSDLAGRVRNYRCAEWFAADTPDGSRVCGAAFHAAPRTG